MSREEAIEILSDMRAEYNLFGDEEEAIRYHVLSWAIQEMKSAQPELVRCKDCKWYEIYQLKQDGTDDRRYNPSYCTLFRHRFKPDWYCADGERREDGELA